MYVIIVIGPEQFLLYHFSQFSHNVIIYCYRKSTTSIIKSRDYQHFHVVFFTTFIL